jgi:hypothetical protein
MVVYSSTPGNTETINGQLPLNVPLHLFVYSAASGANGSGPYTIRMQDVTVAPAAPSKTKFDFDGDAKADISFFRPSDRVWNLNRSTLGFSAMQFGLSTDKIVPADYDGDGKTDQAVFRDGIWYVLQSSQGFTAFQWGISTDIPTPADYDGDGKADAAVFRDGVWYILQSANGFAASQFGLTNDKPLSAAYLP